MHFAGGSNDGGSSQWQGRNPVWRGLRRSWVGQPLRRDRQRLVRGGDPLHGLPYVACYVAKAAVNNFTMGLGPAVRKGWDPRQRGDARPNEHIADLSADLRPIRERRGNGEDARRGLSDGAHGNGLGCGKGRVVPDV
jgi:hypothetical protein